MPTYAIYLDANTGQRTICCALCDAVSSHPGDVANKYCARCHLFHELVQDCREAVRRGATHDCGEWRTGRDRCALCERELLVEEAS